MMRLYLSLALTVALGLAGIGMYLQGRKDGRVTCQAAALREREIGRMAADTAASAAATAISNIEVQRVEIIQPVERTIREKLVYRDCRHDPVGLRGVNAALTGARAEPPGGGQLPAASAAGR